MTERHPMGETGPAPKRSKLSIIAIASAMVISSILLVWAYASLQKAPPEQAATPEVPDDVQPGLPTRIVGNPIDVGLTTGMTALSINEPGEMISIRFTAKYSGDARAIVINQQSERQVDLVVGLQEDNGGVPKGEWMGGSGFASARLETKGFVEMDLQSSVSLTAGKVYHAVIQQGNATASDEITVLAYPANNFAQPLNDDNPDVPWADPRLDMLSYDGRAWEQEGSWPVFVIKYSDGRSEGQPYSLAAPWVIYGSRYVGQTMVPSADYSVEAMSFVVNANGRPADKLYYEIRDPGNNTIAEGLFAEAGQLTTSKKWVESRLDSPVTLQKGQPYRFVLLSPGTDLKEPYQLFGHEFTYDTGVGYGALRHHLTISYDAGATWNQWDDADAIFKLAVLG